MRYFAESKGFAKHCETQGYFQIPKHFNLFNIL